MRMWVYRNSQKAETEGELQKSDIKKKGNGILGAWNKGITSGKHAWLWGKLEERQVTVREGAAFAHL